MSKLDIINDEIARREDSTASIIKGEADLAATIEQLNKLDEFYRESEKESRETLECIYGESRHFTGEWPIVYSFAETEKFPFTGQTDAECNPYFPITKVLDKTFDGLEPLEALPTRTGDYQRQRTFTDTEDIPRGLALIELQNFPDISGEPLPVGFPGPQQTGPPYCSGENNPPQLNQASCEADNGTWNNPGDPIPDPVWIGADTAPALLRVALNAWKTDIQAIQADVCETGTAEFDFWQAIIDDIDIVLPAVASDAVFVRNTGNPDPATWGQTQAFTGAVETARANLETAANTGIPSHISTRESELADNAEAEEGAFFGFIKLRLHQANGSYAKVQVSKSLQGTNDSLKADNAAAIASLNLLKVKNS